MALSDEQFNNLVIFSVALIPLSCAILTVRWFRRVAANPERYSRFTKVAVALLKWSLIACGSIVVVAKAREELREGKPAIGLGLTVALALAGIKGILTAFANQRDPD